MDMLSFLRRVQLLWKIPTICRNTLKFRSVPIEWPPARADNPPIPTRQLISSLATYELPMGARVRLVLAHVPLAVQHQAAALSLLLVCAGDAVVEVLVAQLTAELRRRGCEDFGFIVCPRSLVEGWVCFCIFAKVGGGKRWSEGEEEGKDGGDGPNEHSADRGSGANCSWLV